MRKFKKLLKDLSISNKFTLSLVTIIIVPLVFIIIFINQNIIETANRQICKTNLEILKQTQTSLQQLISDANYISTNVLGNNSLQSYMKSYKKEDSNTLENQKIRVNYEIQSLLSSREYIASLSVYDEEMIHFQFGKTVGEERMEILPAVASLKGRVMWVPATFNHTYLYNRDRMYEVSMIRAINDLEVLEKKIGYQRISIPESYICSLYREMSTESTYNIFIVNHEGDIISSLDKELLGANIEANINLKQLFEKKEGYFVTNKDVLVSYYTLKNPAWAVVKLDNVKAIYKKTGFNNSIILVCIFCTSLFGIIFLYIQNKTIIKPVRKLSKEVAKFREGNYAIHRHVYSQDEIGVLNKSFVEMSIYIQDLVERVYKSQLREKEAQLKSLQAQINPHFLYNTLDAIRWMAIKEKQVDIAEQIQALSSLFKHSLNGGKEVTTIGEEIEHLKNYMLIQQNRFGDELACCIHVDPDIYECKTLKLILQPLVENAIVHGLENKIGERKIEVRIEKIEQAIRYIVTDNGLGTDQEALHLKLKDSTQTHKVFALNNIQERIQYRYGELYGITFKSEIGMGTTVEVMIPVERD